ncbi:MAG: FRG domain-containing protein [Pyrinomonadaceae bacterium]
MITTKVENVIEAVKLASKWKTQGKYDWFRGQTHLWPVTPTIARPKVKFEDVSEKLCRYEAWLKHTPGLEYLAQNVDMALAVAQHYGIPTSFVDFTTNPKIAGFFASHGNGLKQGQDCCIYCLNTKDLESFFESYFGEKQDFPKIEFLKIEIKDLWRLEAQEGVFLYCPYQSFENFYSFDKIVFPYDGEFEIPIEKVYPDRKSHLEILLDHFFATEVSFAGNELLRQWAEKGEIKIFDLPDNRSELEKYFFVDRITRLDSWNTGTLTAWLNPEREIWNQISSKRCWEFIFYCDESAIVIQRKLEEQLMQRFSTYNGCRNELVDWKFILKGKVSRKSKAISSMEQVARRIFDGMRKLPYTDEEVAKSISMGLALNLLWLQSGKSKMRGDWKTIFSSFIQDPLEVEFGSPTGIGSRAFVSRERLFSCVRDDISELIKPEFRERFLPGIIPTIQFITVPSDLFDFNKLRKLFVEELLPTQVASRENDFPFYFNLARLSLFGLG